MDLFERPGRRHLVAGDLVRAGVVSAGGDGVGTGLVVIQVGPVYNPEREVARVVIHGQGWSDGTKCIRTEHILVAVERGSVHKASGPTHQPDPGPDGLGVAIELGRRYPWRLVELGGVRVRIRGRCRAEVGKLVLEDVEIGLWC